MSIEAKLFIDNRWNIRDVIAIIERIYKTKVETQVSPDHVDYYYLDFKGRSMRVYPNYYTPVGYAMLLSLGGDDDAHKIFMNIAKVLGGILRRDDSTNKYEFYEGSLLDDDKLSYFVKYAIINDGIDPDDLEGFLKSMDKWYRKIDPNGKQK